MKKIFALCLAIAVTLSLLAACGQPGGEVSQPPSDPPVTTQTPEPTPEPTSEPTPSGPDFVNWTTVVTEDFLGQDLVFNVLPDGYNTYETEHEGSDMIIRYTTDVYEDGVTYEKFARVYLPYGYDPNDTEKKYNVIYFQHGHQGSPNELFDHDMKSLHPMNLLNNIFDPDHQIMEECIIVCPTFYLEYDETKYVTPGDNPAGDGRYEGIPGNYYLEVLEDLIPAVESQLNVYCDDFSPEGIKATRDHRAWAGYSRGSVCTFYMFHHNFEYFHYWMPMSAECMPLAGTPGESTGEKTYNFLAEPILANPDLDFFLFSTSGGKNDAAPNLQTQIKYLAESDLFSFGADPEENNLYFMRSDFLHNDLYFPYTLANAADILFH